MATICPTSFHPLAHLSVPNYPTFMPLLMLSRHNSPLETQPFYFLCHLSHIPRRSLPGSAFHAAVFVLVFVLHCALGSLGANGSSPLCTTTNLFLVPIRTPRVRRPDFLQDSMPAPSSI